MYAEERQQAMAQLVAEHGRLSVAVIAEQFDVTTETVRRDLSALERMGWSVACTVAPSRPARWP